MRFFIFWLLISGVLIFGELISGALVFGHLFFGYLFLGAYFTGIFLTIFWEGANFGVYILLIVYLLHEKLWDQSILPECLSVLDF